MVDKSDDDDSSESSDEEQTEVFTAKEYKKYLKSIPAEYLKRIREAATKENLPVATVNVSDSSSAAEVTSTVTCATTLTFTTELEEMEYLYSHPSKKEIRSPFVFKSIANYLKDKVFPTVKFWADSDMKFTQPDFSKKVLTEKKEQARRICEKILEHLGREPDSGSGYSYHVCVPFWRAYRTEIKDELVRYRANVGSQAKEMYLEACDDNGSGNLPFGDVQKLRELCRTNSLLDIRNTENAEAFKAFVCVVLPAVVRKLHFRNNRCHKPISDPDFVSIPDEAFGLLILENNFDKWEQYVANGRKCDIAKKTQTKFAPTVRSTNWASNTAALTRYNAYYRMIEQRRLDSEQQDIEKEIMESFQEEYGSKIRRTGKRRFAEMNGTTEGNEETMPPLPIAAIDSFA